MIKPRILFMGTPAFALPALSLLQSGGYPVIAVVTQPDRPRGRGQKTIAPPVKEFAEKFHIPVYQPDKVKDKTFLDELRLLNPEMIVVAAFGQILSKEIIDFPRLGCLNIHPSLLPRYRGAAPLNWAIIHGEKTTGVTIMKMDEGMDSGDIILQKETPMDDNETFGQLHDRLAAEGAKLLILAIDAVAAGTAKRHSQDATLATFAPRLRKEDGIINWNADIFSIVNLIRGLSPSPAAYTYLGEKTLKIFSAAAEPGRVSITPGKIAAVSISGISVAAVNGFVTISELQLENKKRMPASDFLRGYHLPPGTTLGRTTS